MIDSIFTAEVLHETARFDKNGRPTFDIKVSNDRLIKEVTVTLTLNQHMIHRDGRKNIKTFRQAFEVVNNPLSDMLDIISEGTGIGQIQMQVAAFEFEKALFNVSEEIMIMLSKMVIKKAFEFYEETTLEDVIEIYNEHVVERVLKQ